eukprot:TRINITY_DN520_c0_g1_i1.p1 TRINITY_DN520_c0_g1~~TRINITY_DN520_c0_g1_i1.p1  ORF type:complete len:567 (-),score=86.59 TRINITY_DN520_c0_g1_i1:32-1732(-)
MTTNVWNRLSSRQNIAWALKDKNPRTIYALELNQTHSHLISTQDFFQTKEVLLEDVASFLTFKNVLVAQTYNADHKPIQLKTSSDSGRTWLEASFPEELGTNTDKFEIGFVWPTPENALYVSIRDTSSFNVQYRDIYKSDSKFSDFALSLKYSAHYERASLEGIFFGLVYNQEPRPESDIQTLWSFDGGEQWQLLTPPEKSVDGVPYRCNMSLGCSLHLQGNRWIGTRYESFTFIYSTDEAVGIILASGNVGTKLDKDYNDLNTYLSRDAGSTWTEIAKGQFIPEMGDHGGIIIFGDYQHPSIEILFTLDEGKTFTSCAFTNSPMNISNIVVASSRSRKFVLYGQRDGNSVVVGLDMTRVLAVPCVESDYEVWIPSFKGRECLLGQKVAYLRKKQDSLCYYGDEHETRTVLSNCSCAIDDFECSYCFNFVDGKCVFDCKDSQDEVDALPYPDNNCDGMYSVKGLGWRKVAGDMCDESHSDSVKLSDLPAYISCNLKVKSSSSILVVIVALVFIFAIAAVVGIVLFKKSKKCKECIQYTFDRSRPANTEYTKVQMLDEDDEGSAQDL